MVTEGKHAGGWERPAVTVIVPFLGDLEAARRMLAGLALLRLERGDELIVADNTGVGLVEALTPAGVAVVAAPELRSSYRARNAGAARATGEWLLFVDSDCTPSASLIDDYFGEPPPPAIGALAGSIVAAPGETLAERWAESRRLFAADLNTGLPGGPAAPTANLLVRRAAFERLGGFVEGIRSGGDFDFCWRLQEAGWELGWRPQAVVAHRNRRSLRALARQNRDWGASGAWLNRRRPGSAPAPHPISAAIRSLAAAVAYFGVGRFERARLRAVDALVLLSNRLGYLDGNAATALSGPPVAPERRGLVIATDQFPAVSETFVSNEAERLLELGWAVRVEALRRPPERAPEVAAQVPIRYLEDEGKLERVGALASLLARHPLRCVADLWARRGFEPLERVPLSTLAPAARRLERGRERHLHAHFAGLAAANALRIGALAGVPVSVVAHGHDVFGAPRSLALKLGTAAFVVAPCEYTARHLRALVPDAGERIEVVVMGIDPQRFHRGGPPGDGRSVLAIGRLVEKKGFAHLIEAASLLAERQPVELTIVGDGPLREQLERRAAELGIGGAVNFTGSVGPSRVRELLEHADLLAMPCVVAADGDRDAMPMVVKEALAMEVPVVGSDEVGLPEAIEPGWGRLVAPGSAPELAGAIEDLLALPAAHRHSMGQAGRRFVTSECTLDSQVSRTISLIESVDATPAGPRRRRAEARAAGAPR